MHVQGVRRTRLKAMLEADLNLITYHLPLDAHPELGNNAALADAAGCTEQAPGFAYRGPTIGMLGELAEATPFSTWVKDFEANLRHDCHVETGPFQVWPFGPDEIESVGFVSGAAPYQVQDAIDLGLDCYVTGEATEGVYHLAKEAGIHFIGAGHYLSERLGVQRLGEWAAKQFGLDHQFIDVDTRA
jgi:dinuclear metal center YbgI/SA1388 family protein